MLHVASQEHADLVGSWSFVACRRCLKLVMTTNEAQMMSSNGLNVNK